LTLLTQHFGSVLNLFDVESAGEETSATYFYHINSQCSIGRRNRRGIMAARRNFVAVGSVKPAMGTLGQHVISMPKAKKKAKKRSK
jgi:hypothetical protein